MILRRLLQIVAHPASLTGVGILCLCTSAWLWAGICPALALLGAILWIDGAVGSLVSLRRRR